MPILHCNKILTSFYNFIEKRVTKFILHCKKASACFLITIIIYCEFEKLVLNRLRMRIYHVILG